MHTSLTVLGLAGLLGISAMMLPAAKKLRVPYTVLLAFAGCLLGLLSLWGQEIPQPGFSRDFFLSLKFFKITADGVLFIFLPALVFESALSINTHRLIEDLIPILVLSVLGLLISTLIIGAGILLVSNMSWLVCLLLGAILSATDPVAVVALFKELQAPKRLAILVEGESLFNDATAIVLFAILSGMITQGHSASFLSGTFLFFKIFLGGILIGFAGGWVLCELFRMLGKFLAVEITLTLCLAYLSFVVAEHYFHVSGVMAVVSGGLVLGARGRSIISPANWTTLKEIWEYIGFWANSLIFLLVGLVVPKIISEFQASEFGLLLTLLVSAFLGRMMVIYGLVPVFHRLNLIENISFPFKTVMFWGGLRGAVSLALGLSVIENTAFTEETRHFVGVLVTGFVLFTLFVNATTVGKLMKFFGLDQLSRVDSLIRSRALQITLKELAEKIGFAARDFQVSPEMVNAMSQRFLKSGERSQAEARDLETVSQKEWIKIGLMDLTHHEREAYLKLFDDHWIDPDMARILLNQSEDLLDAIRSSGIDGYQAGWKHHLDFNWRFYMGRKLQEMVGYKGLLSLYLSNRLENLIFQKKILQEIISHQLDKLESILGGPVTLLLRRELEKRLKFTNRSLDLIKLQYPQYTRVLENRYLERMALRMEDRKFRELLENSLISREVFLDLEKAVDTAGDLLEKKPPLDLELEPEKLLARVPLFAQFPETQFKAMAALLHPHLAIPDEKIVTRGEMGDAMYFISSGSIEVQVEPQPVLLGSGDFFGEIALVKNQPRMADVIALGFCNLLILRRSDFEQFMNQNPDLRALVEKTVQERLKEDNLL